MAKTKKKAGVTKKKTQAKKPVKNTQTKDSQFQVELIDLLEAGCHFGHQVRRWNPKMAPYIYDQRDKIHIFDLAITAKKLTEACEYVKTLTQKGGRICFVGTKRQARAIVKEEAKRVNMPYITERWLGGTLTNWQQIQKSIKDLLEMKEKKAAGEYEKYTKKENVLLNRKINRLERFFGGLASLEDLPEAIFVVDSVREATAVREANQTEIPVVGLIDTNADPDLVDYAISANDDAVRSIKLIVAKIADAVQLGQELAEKSQKEKK